jgi:hypothetical protein
LTCASAPLAIVSVAIAVSGSRCGFSPASSMHAVCATIATGSSAQSQRTMSKSWIIVS